MHETDGLAALVVAQLGALGLVAVWTLGSSVALVAGLRLVLRLRVDHETATAGLDLSLHGEAPTR